MHTQLYAGRQGGQEIDMCHSQKAKSVRHLTLFKLTFDTCASRLENEPNPHTGHKVTDE